MISFSAYIWVINKDTNMCFRILEIPHNPIEYLLYPIVGVIFRTYYNSSNVAFIFKSFFQDTFYEPSHNDWTKIIIHLMSSLANTSVHTPFYQLDGNYLGFLITVLLCIICTITGIYLTQWFPSIFNSNARKN